MSNIISYPKIPALSPDDLMLISDVDKDGKPLRSVSIGKLASYIEGGGGTSTSINGEIGEITFVSGNNVTIDQIGKTFVINSTAGGSGDVGGSGTAKSLPVWTDGTTLGDSIITNNGLVADVAGYLSVTTPGDPNTIRLSGKIVDIVVDRNTPSPGDGAFGFLDAADNTRLIQFGYDDDGPSDAFAWNYTSNGGFKVGTNNIERLRVTSAGDVGIGTDIPSEKLEVDGNVKATSFIKTGGQATEYLMADGSVTTGGGGGGGVDGSGTANKLPKWSDSDTLTDSLIEDDGSTVSVSSKFSVLGGSAGGPSSISLGAQSSSGGYGAIAIGNNADAQGFASIAIGLDTVASGGSSTAMGEKTTASGSASFTAGLSSKSGGFAAGSIGKNTESSGDYSFSTGEESLASGDYSTAMGYDAAASGEGATALGFETVASGDKSFAVGLDAVATGIVSTALGSRTDANGSYSVAMNRGSKSDGDRSTAMGLYTISGTNESLSIGKYNLLNQTSDNTAFVIGNSDDSNNRSDAFHVDFDGNATADSFIKAGGLSTEYLMADGSTTTSGGGGGHVDTNEIAFFVEWTSSDTSVVNFSPMAEWDISGMQWQWNYDGSTGRYLLECKNEDWFAWDYRVTMSANMSAFSNGKLIQMEMLRISKSTILVEAFQIDGTGVQRHDVINTDMRGPDIEPELGSFPQGLDIRIKRWPITV